MSRSARVVVPGIPHHVTQRGNRRQKTFFSDENYTQYLDILAACCHKYGIEIWAYCLMPNHVHLIAVPERPESLRRGIGAAHQVYTQQINEHHEWSGHLWQGRFSSFPMDEPHLLAAARYIELNPVRAGIAQSPEDYRWSSVHAHRLGADDRLVNVEPLLKRVANWKDFLSEGLSENDRVAMRAHEKSGLPLGEPAFISKLEESLGVSLQRKLPGRPPKEIIRDTLRGCP